MTQVTLDEAQSKLRELVQAALGGDEVVIGENGHAVKLVPVPDEEPQPAKGRPKAGSAKGMILYMADDFDAPLEDFKEYME